MNRNRAGLTTLETALIVVVVVVGAALSALLYIEWSNYNALHVQYAALQTQYNGLETNYTALANKYQALKTNYTSLQGQYNQLLNDYDGLQIQYSALQDQYNALQGEYNSLQSQYNNVTNLLNNFVNSLSGSGSGTVNAGYVEYIGLVYVPGGCTVQGTLTVSTSGPVNVYIGDWISTMNYYAYIGGASSYGSWSWIYQWYGTSYVNQPVSFSTGYSGDYYVLIIENTNNYDVSYTYSLTISHVYCPPS